MKANQLKKLKEDKTAFTNLVPMILGIIIVFALLFIGGYINGIIHDELQTSIGTTTGGAGPGTWQNVDRFLENATKASMNNTSENYDSALNIVQVVIIITVLAAAIGAIFMFTRYR